MTATSPKFYNQARRQYLKIFWRVNFAVLFLALTAIGALLTLERVGEQLFPTPAQAAEVSLYASEHEGSVEGISTEIATIKASTGEKDPRAYVLDEYFRKHNSPMYGTGEIFVEACDRWGAPRDCTTLPAIAKFETDLCKYYNSADYHNCWGFGGPPPYRMQFDSWEESINLITDRLVNQYGISYMENPRTMERTYCGTEPNCIYWGGSVAATMQQISEYARELGLGYSLFELR